ncbi:hypothetical protein [uncultured Gimesia sp.]|uniref:DUF6896 domain-containing protein n=1 Tax=uncultured Gimesia sp. TaxID=1678688 RepID=UPI0026269F3D|nr:hypothetical protein [uncultured Gimesia sp.]
MTYNVASKVLKPLLLKTEIRLWNQGSDVLFQEIQNRIAGCLDSGDVERFIHHCLSNPLPISPWGLWTLCSLVKHRQRQEFVLECVRFKLDGDPVAIAAAGAFAHPPIKKHGLVPGDTDWKYNFHGRGCRLKNRISGECIDVDFFDDTADWFDDYFYNIFLKSLKQPEIWEQRVIELHPSIDTVLLAFDELQNAGLLEKHSDKHVVRLSFETNEILHFLECIEGFPSSNHLVPKLAAALGDWELLKSISLDDRFQKDVAAADELNRLEREKMLLNCFENSNRQRHALKAIFEIESCHQYELLNSSLELPHDEVLNSALQLPNAGAISTALEVILSSKDSTWCPEVLKLLNRTNPCGDLPQPQIWLICMEYLCQYSENRDALSNKLRQASRHSIAEAGILALEYRPTEALSLFRRAIRSKTRHNRIVSVAVLALINKAWAHNELLDLLKSSDDHSLTAECRAAIREMPHPQLHKIVDEWENNNPHEPETGKWITMQEVFLRGTQERVKWEMVALHDRILPLRDIVPPEPSRKWWKLW